MINLTPLQITLFGFFLAAVIAYYVAWIWVGDKPKERTQYNLFTNKIISLIALITGLAVIIGPLVGWYLKYRFWTATSNEGPVALVVLTLTGHALGIATIIIEKLSRKIIDHETTVMQISYLPLYIGIAPGVASTIFFIFS